MSDCEINVFTVVDNEGNAYVIKQQCTITLAELQAGTMNHPHIISYKDVKFINDEVEIITSPVGTPLSKIYQSVLLPMNDRYVIIRDIIDGLLHLHYNGYVHNDIGLDNIIVVNGRGIIIDLGNVTFVHDKSDYQLDLVALAIIILELLTRQTINVVPRSYDKITKLYENSGVKDVKRWSDITYSLISKTISHQKLRDEFDIDIIQINTNTRLNSIISISNLPQHLIQYVVQIKSSTNLTLEQCVDLIDGYLNKDLIKTKIPRPNFGLID